MLIKKKNKMEKIVKKRSRVRVPVFRSSWVGDWKVRTMDFIPVRPVGNVENQLSRRKIEMKSRELFPEFHVDYDVYHRKEGLSFNFRDKCTGETFGAGFLYN